MNALELSMRKMNVHSDVEEIEGLMKNMNITRPKKVFEPKVENGNPYNRKRQVSTNVIQNVDKNKQLVRKLRGLE